MHFFVTHVVVPYMPHHSAPRLGSVCPLSGIAPWARREGPSMAQRGYLGIHAEVPTAQYLRAASVVNGASRSRSRSKAKQERGVYPASVWLIHRYREQARSHMEWRVFTASAHDTKNLWERACSRWRRHSQHHHKLPLRFREQARSHMGLWVFTASAHDTKNCGSGLARDGVSTANITTN